jgi:HEAT repeat protein
MDRLWAMLAKSGLAEGRRASCAALTRFTTREADELVRALLADPDAAVQAAALKQLRPRGFPDATKLLVEHLESSAVEIRDAARAALAEFNYVRYRGMFDLLDESTARSTGRLVRKVDDKAMCGLLEDLTAPSVSTKLRAIEMAVAMGVADDVSDQLISLASSENLDLRQEAICALGTCTGSQVLKVLQSAAQDAHQAVREAALRSLEQFHAGTIAVPVLQAVGELP